MDILNSINYCILCLIDLLLVKIKFLISTLKLLYIIDYLLFKQKIINDVQQFKVVFFILIFICNRAIEHKLSNC